jgi:C-terminal processing protease CtpA/Prc
LAAEPFVADPVGRASRRLSGWKGWVTMRGMALALLLTLLPPALAWAQPEAPLLLQKPTASRTQVVFVHAGDLWTAPREGGDARRLTTGVGVETSPLVSPDGMSGGRVAYVYLPDTYYGGFTSFNRYFFAQVGKEGVVVDERFNGGGLIADYVIDYLRRPLAGYFTQREGEDWATPVGAIYGPKAMIIDEFAGSGGDAMPWLFRNAKLGPLVGKRTWGGLVGVSGFELIDGGYAGVPQSGFWNPNGTWDVENFGVAPDIEVELDPRSVRDGHDPQLEKAVAVVMAALKKNPLPKHRRPPYPNYHKKR